jgi:hypothetical protein
MKAVKATFSEDKDRVEKFEKGAQAFAKKIIANFKDYEFVSSPRNFFLWLRFSISYSSLASLQTPMAWLRC